LLDAGARGGVFQAPRLRARIARSWQGHVSRGPAAVSALVAGSAGGAGVHAGLLKAPQNGFTTARMTIASNSSAGSSLKTRYQRAVRVLRPAAKPKRSALQKTW